MAIDFMTQATDIPLRILAASVIFILALLLAALRKKNTASSALPSLFASKILPALANFLQAVRIMALILATTAFLYSTSQASLLAANVIGAQSRARIYQPSPVATAIPLQIEHQPGTEGSGTNGLLSDAPLLVGDNDSARDDLVPDSVTSSMVDDDLAAPNEPVAAQTQFTEVSSDSAVDQDEEPALLLSDTENIVVQPSASPTSIPVAITSPTPGPLQIQSTPVVPVLGLNVPATLLSKTQQNLPYKIYIPFLTKPALPPLPSPTPATTQTPVTPLPHSPVDLARALDLQPPRSINVQSKIGVGVYADGGGYVLNELLKLRPGVVVLMDPKPEFAREIRKQLPKAFIFGRRFVSSQPLDDPETRGSAFADYVAQLAVPLKGIVDGWMSYNEPVGRGDVAGLKAYNAFQVAFAKRLQATYGIGAVAGNDPPGAVDIAEYPKYFGEAIRISKFFGVHAYSSREGRSLREPDSTWYALRYRKIYQALAEAGIRSGPIVLTEVGLAKGWRELNVNEEAVVADLVWLADEVAKDDYVLGFAIFGIFPSGGWHPFNIASTSILERLSRYDPANPLRISVTPSIPIGR